MTQTKQTAGPYKGYRHFRYPTADGSARTKGGVTMAFISPKHIHDLTATDEVVVGLAFCSKEDNYARGPGRDVAGFRLTAGDNVKVAGDVFLSAIQQADPEIMFNRISAHLDPAQVHHLAGRLKCTGPY